MSLITKKVQMKWSGGNKNKYITKGYKFTRMNDIFEINVNDLSKGSKVKVEVDCDGVCGKVISITWGNYNKYVKDNGKYYCKICKNGIQANEKCISFFDWCISNERTDLLDRWNYKANCSKPNNILYSSNMDFWFNCPREIHHPELKKLNKLVSDSNSGKCKKCNSFAQWGIDYLGEDFIETYWDYNKNTQLNISPWEISYGSEKKVWIKCPTKSYHDSYLISCNSFSSGKKCPYCYNRLVHPNDSLGNKIITEFGENFLDIIWSSYNDTSPFTLSPMSKKEVWWKCPDGKHKDFLRGIDKSNVSNFRCNKCKCSKGEKKIEDFLLKNNIEFEPQKKYSTLYGIKNRKLSYDFYLPFENLLIEYQGQYHDGSSKIQTLEGYSIQKEHDKRKKKYAKENNISLLEIWYWNINKIDEILEEKIRNLKGGEK